MSSARGKRADEVGGTELAHLLGITTRTLFNLREQGMPHRADGRFLFYPVPDAPQWYYRWKLAGEAEKPATDDGKVSMAEAERRRAVADAEKREMEVQQMREELVPRDQYRYELSEVLHRVRSCIVNHPKLRGDLADQILLDLRDAMPPFVDDPDSSPDQAA